MIEMWIDSEGRVWADTGHKDPTGDVIVELLNGAVRGPFIKIALEVGRLTNLRDR
jgi:hypothetical protein